LLMDDHLLSLENIKLPSKSSTSSVDIQWLSPIDCPLSDAYQDKNRVCYKFDGSASLRFFTCHSDLTGNDIRQYFLEDLFRSMLIRLNLTLMNIDSNSNQNPSIARLVLPRRIYVNQPVFVSAYQLFHEQLSSAIDSFQENFKITSLLEEDLEAAEEFPVQITSDERIKQLNTNTTKDTQQQSSSAKKSAYQNFVALIEQYFGTGNAVLVILIFSIAVLLLSIMIKLFT
ncbi:unnamed protein product, partial [Adineta ricciae]